MPYRATRKRFLGRFLFLSCPKGRRLEPTGICPAKIPKKRSDRIYTYMRSLLAVRQKSTLCLSPVQETLKQPCSCVNIDESSGDESAKSPGRAGRLRAILYCGGGGGGGWWVVVVVDGEEGRKILLLHFPTLCAPQKKRRSRLKLRAVAHLELS